jgi:hypothetical protein
VATYIRKLFEIIIRFIRTKFRSHLSHEVALWQNIDDGTFLDLQKVDKLKEEDWKTWRTLQLSIAPLLELQHTPFLLELLLFSRSRWKDSKKHQNFCPKKTEE